MNHSRLFANLEKGKIKNGLLESERQYLNFVSDDEILELLNLLI